MKKLKLNWNEISKASLRAFEWHAVESVCNKLNIGFSEDEPVYATDLRDQVEDILELLAQWYSTGEKPEKLNPIEVNAYKEGGSLCAELALHCKLETNPDEVASLPSPKIIIRLFVDENAPDNTYFNIVFSLAEQIF